MRDAKNFVVVGAKKCGKTTTVIKMMEKFNRPGLIITSSQDGSLNQFPTATVESLTRFQEWPRKIHRINLLHEYRAGRQDEVKNLLLTGIIDHVKNASILFDDAGSIFDFQRQGLLLAILENTRHLSIDIFFNYHNLDQVPNMIFTHINYLIIFPTGIRAINKINKLQDKHRDMVRQAVDYLNSMFEKHGENYGANTKGGHLMIQIS